MTFTGQRTSLRRASAIAWLLDGSYCSASESHRYSRWFEARRAASAGGGAEEQLYADYGSVVGVLRGLGGEAPADGFNSTYDSAAAALPPSDREQGSIQNAVYMTMEPAGTDGLRSQTDEVAENMFHLTQANRQRWRSKRLAECHIEEVEYE